MNTEKPSQKPVHGDLKINHVLICRFTPSWSIFSIKLQKTKTLKKTFLGTSSSVMYYESWSYSLTFNKNEGTNAAPSSLKPDDWYHVYRRGGSNECCISFQLKKVKTKRIIPSGHPQAALSSPSRILQTLPPTAPSLHLHLHPTAPNQQLRSPAARRRGYVTRVFTDILTYVQFRFCLLTHVCVYQTGLVGLVDYPDDEDEENDEEEQSPRKRPRLGS